MAYCLTYSSCLFIETFHELFVVLIIEQLCFVNLNKGNVYLTYLLLLSLIHLLYSIHLADKCCEDIFECELAKNAADLLVSDLYRRVVSDSM